MHCFVLLGLFVLTYAFYLLSFWGGGRGNDIKLKGTVGGSERSWGIEYDQNIWYKKIKTHKNPCVLETLILGLQAMISQTLQVLEFNPGRKL